MRAVLDGLADGVVASDDQGVIRYVNAAAEDLMGWPHGSLAAGPSSTWCPMAAGRRRASGRSCAPRPRVSPGSCRPSSGAPTAPTSDRVRHRIFDHPLAGPVVVGIFRRRDEHKLARWSELTSELLELLADAPIDDPPAERLLSTLGRRLDWDVTTLWTLTATASSCAATSGRVTPSVAPAFVEEKAADPSSGSDGLPRWVMEHGEPIWVSDLAHERRFARDGLVRHGLHSAYAFPIRYRGALVGIVKMLSTPA